MCESVVRDIQQAWPPSQWRDCHVMVALSGGADSVALLRALVSLHRATNGRGSLLAAHYNHGWRPGAADQDQAWVEQLCQQLGVPLTVGCPPAMAGSLPQDEQSARNARYAFFVEAAQQQGARYVATAHTADDQIETVLMRLFRGSGLGGLGGIPFTRPLTAAVTIVRPLLAVRRSQVEAYLAQLRQPFRTDATNSQWHLTRNWIRGDLLPQIRQRLPHDVDTSLLRLAAQASGWQRSIDQLVEAHGMAGVTIEPPGSDFPGRVLLAREQLALLPPLLLQETCRQVWQQVGWPEQAMGMAQWERLGDALLAEDFPPFELPAGVQVCREGASVVLTRGRP